MRIHQLFLFSLAFALRAKSAGHVADEDFELRQLTDDNFKANIAQGLWLVEHFSPKCGHCRAFMPTWTQLAKDKQHLERLSGFHMAQVNCLAQGDLCNSNGIKFYPQLMLYSNGQLVEPSYSGDRSYGDLSRWIDTHSHSYAEQQLLKPLLDGGASGQGEAEAVYNAGRPNPEGKIMEVDEDGLQALKARGPVFAEYFAPWCGHCKKLRPTYEKLAEALKGKINIAAVDCDANKPFCRREGVMGYPTLRMLSKDKQTDYNGARSLDAMRIFALKSVETPAIRPLKLEDFDTALKSDDAFFLYLQNFDTEVADVERVKKTMEPILADVPVYTSADPLFYANLSIAQPPTSALLAFSNHHARPVGSLSFPAEQKDLDRFVTVHRFPTLVHLTSSNYNAIMKSDSRATVVLAALHKGDEGEREKEKLMSVARAWKRGGRGFQQPVWFVWVEGEKWGGWLKQSYGIRKKELPAVVVVDPALSEYYDMTIEGKKISFEGAAIFSVLEGFYQHFLVPKRVETTLEWGSRSATMTLINLSNLGADHPLLAFFTVVGGVAIFVFLLQRCMKRDPREGRDAPRLD